MGEEWWRGQGEDRRESGFLYCCQLLSTLFDEVLLVHLSIDLAFLFSKIMNYSAILGQYIILYLIS